MKITTVFASLFMIAFLSFNALAGDNELIDTIQHTQKAITADNAKDVARHAEDAKGHANSAKTDKYINIDNQEMDIGIVFLDQAIKQGEAGQTQAAKDSASDALKHFLNASKD